MSLYICINRTIKHVLQRPRKNDVRFVFTLISFAECFINHICIYLYILVSNMIPMSDDVHKLNIMLTVLLRFVRTVSLKINPNHKSNHNFKANYFVMSSHNNNPKVYIKMYKMYKMFVGIPWIWYFKMLA
jgi:hypothetical protein